MEMTEVHVRRVKGNLSAWFAVKKFSGMFQKKYFGEHLTWQTSERKNFTKCTVQ